MTKNNKIEFDINKMNDCLFTSIHNRVANELVFRGWELMARFAHEHGNYYESLKVKDSIYEQNGFVPPTHSEILNQFMDDIHSKIKKSGTL